MSQQTMIENPDGTVLVNYDDTRQHQKYVQAGGTRVRGVTTIINEFWGGNKQVLINWAIKECQAGRDPMKVRDKAATIGSCLHFINECHIMSALTGKTHIPNKAQFSPEMWDKAENAYIAFLDFEKEKKIRWMDSEKMLISELAPYGGTLDALAVVDDKFTLVDFKTSSGIYDEMRFQAVAYHQLCLEHGIVPEQIIIVQFGKEDGKFHHDTIIPGTADYNYFRAVWECLLNIETLKRGRDSAKR